MRVLLALLVFAVALTGQIGQYPPGYPRGGGRYPGDRNPPPRDGRQRQPRTESPAQPLNTVSGVLEKIDDKSLLLAADDTRMLTLKVTDKTVFTGKKAEGIHAADFKPGDHLSIDTRQDVEGYLYAVNVRLEKEGTPAERASVSRPVEGPAPQNPAASDEAPVLRRRPASPSGPPERAIDEDDAPPRLKRGVPEKKKRSEPEAVADAAPPPAAPASTADTEPDSPPAQPASLKAESIIDKVRAAAESFTESLPNYVCQQFTTRYASEARPVSWHAQDVVSATVVYENGQESYRNIAINNKTTSKTMDDLPGARSTGEFGTILRDLLSPATGAKFRYRRQEPVSRIPALVYDYEVARENSRWRVQMPSQWVTPAYRGTLWVDKKTYRVLRIEMEARNVPTEFPLDTVETAVEYQYIRLGTTTEFLLPVHGEVLACQRGSSFCSRNVIEFRNYHKYAGEASITFEKQ